MSFSSSGVAPTGASLAPFNAPCDAASSYVTQMSNGWVNKEARAKMKMYAGGGAVVYRKRRAKLKMYAGGGAERTEGEKRSRLLFKKN